MAIVLAAPLLKMLAIGIAVAAVWLLKQTGSLESAQNIIASLLNDNTIDQDTADNLKIEMSLYIKAIDDAKVSLINWEDTIKDVQNTQNENEDKELENNPASEEDKAAYRKARSKADELQLKGQRGAEVLRDELEREDATPRDIDNARAVLDRTKYLYEQARKQAEHMKDALGRNNEVKNDLNTNEYYVLNTDDGIVSIEDNTDNTRDI